MKVDQRQALATLSKARLCDLADFFDLASSPTLLKGELIDLLARSRRASFKKILGELMRDDLKAICRDAGLDDSGKRKDVLVDRLLGRSTPPQTPPVEEQRPAAKPPQPSAPAAGDPPWGPVQGRPEAAGVLENRLWGAADELRANSKLRASEYSTPVLGLIFLRYADSKFIHAEEGLGRKQRRVRNRRCFKVC